MLRNELRKPTRDTARKLPPWKPPRLKPPPPPPWPRADASVAASATVPSATMAARARTDLRDMGSSPRVQGFSWGSTQPIRPLVEAAADLVHSEAQTLAERP